MKNIRNVCIYILLLLIPMGSCVDDFLNQVPQAVLFDHNLTNKDGIESLLIGAYANLGGLREEPSEGGFDWAIGASGSNWIYSDVYSDEAYTGSFPGDQPDLNYIEAYNQVDNNLYITGKWRAVYDGISRSNDVIRLANLAYGEGNITEPQLTKYIAEARFLRAYFHLEAIKMWDFVPFIDEASLDGMIENVTPGAIEPNAGDTKWGELGGDGYIPWAEVESDFKFALENLPFPPENKGRAHKYAATGLLAKTKLFQNKYNEALPILNQIIDHGEFRLVDNYHDNFRTSGDNSEESIFQIQASVNDGAIFLGGSANGNFGDILNFPHDVGPGKCCGFFQPSQNLVNAFKTTDGIIAGVMAGLPYLETFNLDFNAEGDDVINDEGIESSEDFIPDTRPLDPRLDWTVGRRGIPYLDWGIHPGKDWIRNQPYAGPYTSIKHVYYFSEEGINSSQTGWGGSVESIGLTANNYSIMRYADVLLMAAECEVEMDNLNRARELVNMIRGRMADHPEYWVRNDDDSLAANYQIAPYPSGGSSDPFQTKEGAREAVQFERRLEFGLEGHRFWDLKRWGVAKSTLNAYLEKESSSRQYLTGAEFKDKNIRHPIPQVEIDLMKGLLSQNPDY